MYVRSRSPSLRKSVENLLDSEGQDKEPEQLAGRMGRRRSSLAEAVRRGSAEEPLSARSVPRRRTKSVQPDPTDMEEAETRTAATVETLGTVVENKDAELTKDVAEDEKSDAGGLSLSEGGRKECEEAAPVVLENDNQKEENERKGEDSKVKEEDSEKKKRHEVERTEDVERKIKEAVKSTGVEIKEEKIKKENIEDEIADTPAPKELRSKSKRLVIDSPSVGSSNKEGSGGTLDDQVGDSSLGEVALERETRQRAALKELLVKKEKIVDGAEQSPVLKTRLRGLREDGQANSGPARDTRRRSRKDNVAAEADHSTAETVGDEVQAAKGIDLGGDDKGMTSTPGEPTAEKETRSRSQRREESEQQQLAAAGRETRQRTAAAAYSPGMVDGLSTRFRFVVSYNGNRIK